MHPTRKYLHLAITIAPAILAQSIPTDGLAASLQSVIPSCAQPCLASQLAKVYPSTICASTGDLDCLCSHTGLDGYTLGEQAFGCLYAGGCPPAAQTNASQIYNVCLGRTNAVQPTHKTVIVVAVSSTSTSSTLGATPTALLTMTLSSTSSRQSAMVTPTETSVSPAFASTTSRPVNTVRLTEAQVAGIAIASIALVVLTVGIAGCLLYFRRRDKRDEKDSPKLLLPHSRNGSEAHISSFEYSTPTRLGTAGSSTGHTSKSFTPFTPPAPPPPPVPPTRPKPAWPKYYPIMPGEDIGIATTTNLPIPVQPVNVSPTQKKTIGSVSLGAAPAFPLQPSLQPSAPIREAAHEELPPTAHLPPAPSEVADFSRDPKRIRDRTAVISECTVFEDFSPIQPFTDAGQPPQLAKYYANPNNNRASLASSAQAAASKASESELMKARQSRTSLKIDIPLYPVNKPAAVHKGASFVGRPLPDLPSFENPRPSPLHAERRTEASALSKAGGHSRESLKRQRSIPIAKLEVAREAREARKARQAPDSETSSNVPSSECLPVVPLKVRALGAAPTKRPGLATIQPNPPQRSSSASVTSFESLGTDDPTPPEEQKQISNGEGSPIADLHYPKIPRAANQAVARTAPSPKILQTAANTKPITPNKQSFPQSSQNIGIGIGNSLWRTEPKSAQPKVQYQPYRPYRAPPPAPAESSMPPRSKTVEPVTPVMQQRPSQDSQRSQRQTWSWQGGQEMRMTIAVPSSPFGPMPVLTPTRFGDDLYLSVS